MEYMSSIERHGYLNGFIEGFKEEFVKEFKGGFENGWQTALVEAEKRAYLEGMALALEVKFGAAGRRLLKKVRALPDLGALRKFARILKTAETIEEVRRYLECGPMSSLISSSPNRPPC